MGPPGGSGGSTLDESVKDLFDRIGKEVHDQVEKEANQYKEALKGDLSSATFPTGRRHEKPQSESCKLNYIYDTNVTSGGGKENPCYGRQGVRFSDTKGAKCYSYKIEDNDSSIGFCAPYRRLHLCVQNLEQIKPDQITSTHNLLVDVLLAAKYEGQSITQDYPKYQATYDDSPSKMCTMLARSFADIGDIVRGKDLFLGTNEEKKPLEENLKEIFKKIYENLGIQEKNHYNDTPDYYKLREDWWIANRDQVWKAITCNAGGYSYFRKTCGGDNEKNSTLASNKCRCKDEKGEHDTDQVPTYFDYVPQYLRWFEEWAEDFCRKKKIKVENVKKSCRGEDKESKDRYCSRNGYDCEKTKRAIGKLRYGKQCISCLYGCNPYVDWIEKQKEQFDKQKKIYDKEIKKYENGASSSSRKTRAASTTNYEEYEKKFYEELNKSEYSDVNAFLEKLSKEDVCTKVQDDKGGRISFENVKSSSASGGAAGTSSTSGGGTSGDSGTNNENEGTFYRSKYCQPCPPCGVERNVNDWKEKHKIQECKSINLYKPNEYAKPTNITILKSGEGHEDIETKLKAFCDKKDGTGSGDCGGNSDPSLCEPWQCYEEKDIEKHGDVDDDDADGNPLNAGGLCILKNEKHVSETNSQIEPDQFQKTFHDFFYYWVAHMLKDSIHWKKKLQRCLEKKNGNTCKKNNCKDNCGCFEKWVAQKKEQEWDPIKQQFRKQDFGKQELILGQIRYDYVLDELLKKDELLTSIKEGYGDANEIKHIKALLEDEENEETQEEETAGADNQKKNTIDWLIQHEEDDAELCLEIHEDEEEGGGNDECDDDHEEEVYVSNPCATPSGSYPSLANKVAQLMHHKAKTQLAIRAGRSLLRANASKGEYKHEGNPDDFKKEKLCEITAKHSNDSRRDGEPCKGKDGNNERFKIGTEWKIGEKVETSYKDVFLPPRRQHMCTSNLENLDVDSVTENDKASHSLLGDVQLAAKTDAAEIIKRYKDQNNIQLTDPIQQKDQEAMCRAIRYSFADLGDIIRGRDMWNKDSGSTEMEKHLISIFEKINEKLPEKEQKKYSNDGKYLDLRKDWWEANRYKVWKAMKCATKNSKIPCSGIPIEDYIPQRLRWMTEWAEWFCKEQSQAYETLQDQCGKCTGPNKDNCTRDNNDCNTCTKACEEYEQKIKKWADQWKVISKKYEELYLQAKTAFARTAFPDDDPDYQQVVEFFKELQKEINRSASQRSKRSIDVTNTDPTLTSPYSSAAGYIHQEIGNVGCNVQTQFCEKKNGVIPTTGSGTNNKNYAFKNTPKDHDEACECESRPQVPPKKKEDEEDVCEKVKGLLKGKDGETTEINGCKPKGNGNTWNCSNQIDDSHKGACMPPRRQSLCIHNLKESNETGTEQQLREAFINCAAIETFWLWYKYKKDKNVDAEKKLEQGEIPSEFLRSMIYTFGDYRDLCLNTDISAKKDPIKIVKNNIQKVFNRNNGPHKEGDKEKRKKFWETNKNDIWQGMLCALEKIANNKKTLTETYNYSLVKFSGNNSTTLEDFAKTPQFLRWFTEWGDDFCQQQKEQLVTLQEACPNGICEQSEEEKKKCKSACEKYQAFIEKWKGYYDKQSKKYFYDISTGMYKDNSSAKDDVTVSSYAYEYLNKSLKKLCPDGSCSCMEQRSQQHNEDSSDALETHNSIMPQSLDKEPKEVKGRCKCPDPPKPCDIVKDLFENKDDNKFTEACSTKYKNGKEKYTQWKCINDSSNTTRSSPPAPVASSTLSTSPEAGASATCIPPRRQQMYIQPLQSLSGNESQVELRRIFIEMAAIETFFQWHKFKKEKVREIKEKDEIDGKISLFGQDDTSIEENLQKQLKNGTIPDDFKRQMFYTFGDYKDILFGKYIGIDMGTVKTNIGRVFNNGGNKSDEEREKWWKNHGPSIWNGMLCGLSYDTKTKHNIQGVYTQLTDPSKNNMYEKVTFPSKTGPSVNTKLEQFARRPTYFRWLEEWGEEFCKKRTDKLKKLEKECRGVNYSGYNKYCSGDGYHCDDEKGTYNSINANLNCRDCMKECRNYKTWIVKKKNEYDKQKSKYVNEHENVISFLNKQSYKQLYENIKPYSSAADFFTSLNHCKPDKANDDKNNKLNFKNPHETFSPSTYCKACPLNGVICRGRSQCAANSENNLTNLGESTDFDILINDAAIHDNDNEIKKGCPTYEMYKDLRKQKWICQKKTGEVHQCKLNNAADSKYYDNKFPFNILFHRWITDFIQYYNKSKEKIKPCTNDVNSCKQGCKGNCDCVDKWLKNKSTEWEIIKKYYKENFGNTNEHIAYAIKIFLQEGLFDSDYKRAQEVIDQNEWEQLWGCTGDNLKDVKDQKAENCNKGDFITNLISKLQDKITSCQNKHNPNGKTACDEIPPHSDEEETSLLDDDTSTQEKMSPDFCPSDMPEKPKTDSDILCDDKKEPKCGNFRTLFKTSTSKTKTNLIGLEAHNHRAGRFYPNVYISPRAHQLYLEPLKDLKENNTDKNELIKAFTKCAYNEGKCLYEYYSKNKATLGKNGSALSNDEVKTYTLEAMERSYADYGTIVKEDILWDYEDKKKIDPKIMNFAKNHNISTTKTIVSSLDDDDVKRQKLWESIRIDVWKAMICGYKDAIGGDMNSLPNDVDLCTLPTTDDEYSFLRWFVEWGQNFCIRHEKELKQLNEECARGTCDGTDEEKKKKCEKACKNYREFLNNFKKQYENQKKEYEIIKSSYPKYEKKDAFTFLKDKCNSNYSCFENKTEISVLKMFEHPPDDVKDECDCKTSKAHDDKVNDLDKCPNNINNNKNICNKYKKRRICGDLKYSNSLDHWFGTNTLIPPRRRHLCLRNIIIKKNYRKGDISKFKDDLFYAAASEAKFLFNNYENKNESLQAIKYTFADIGDIIKGNDMMDDMTYKKIKGKLEKVLDKTGNNPETPEKWWEQNKKHVWEAMLCGYKLAGGEIKPNDCNIPTEESTHQFLRWLTEWGTQYCKEKQQLKLNMQIPCMTHFDKYGIIENRIDVHPNCLQGLGKYEIWSNNRIPDWERLSSKFNEVKGTMNENVKKLTAYEYLKQNCSKCICSFKDIEQTHKKSKDEGYHIYEDILDKAQIPSFLEDTAYRYKGLNPECPEDIECSQYGNIPCRGVSHDDDNDWNSSFVKDNKTTNLGVLVPPRRRHLCLRIDVNKFLRLRNDINNLKTFICKSAFAEAKRLKKVYKDDNSKLHQAMKYSFSDIGSVVKGNDMMESPTSDNIAKIFRGMKYTEINRETWWDLNKYHVWESMLCGYREAGGDTKKSENCRFPDIERVPQFLRWFQEWTEIFCIKRKTLYDKMVTECQKAECDTSNGTVKETKCTKACEEYKSYVLSKKKEYYIQKDKYDNQFKKVLNNKDAEEFLNVHCLSEYFKDETRWKNPYESIADKALKGKCDCKKMIPTTPEVKPKKPAVPEAKKPEVEPLPSDEPFNRDILEKTIPFGVALALGSIAFLFLKVINIVVLINK
ncbi:hypothetical protein PFNF54_01634 [Plasmodium falciparum NF54]|uniref:Erythrocyte membrane protein 1 n=1 Tax=Plasmodium falciparum (isolate NF54) TaxID=5843 RepID=W7JX21_PLAFO|nr:hypothetical protein PFNF54_01634 [Plasmodium falciparum NF54]